MTYDRVIELLEKPPKVKTPTILPDFFLDHFVIAGTLEDLISDMKSVAEQGGGNILGSKHMIQRGGNSVNTASALHSLGLSPKLIVTTDSFGKLLLKSLVRPDLDLDLVHTDGSLSATVSIEVEYKGRRVNLMVSDSGSVADFSFSDLSEEDLAAIRSSGLVALLCLNHNPKAAELARDLLQFVKQETSAITFMDIGDPSGNPQIVSKLVKDVLKEGLVDILSVNENEVGWFASKMSSDSKHWHNLVINPEKWLPAARLVNEESGARVDLHTPHYSATVSHETVVQPTFVSESRVICGAGDAWNAGDIFGTLHNMSDKDRLLLANAVAALYVSSPSAEHPNPTELVEFLKSNPRTAT